MLEGLRERVTNVYTGAQERVGNGKRWMSGQWQSVAARGDSFGLSSKTVAEYRTSTVSEGTTKRLAILGGKRFENIKWFSQAWQERRAKGIAAQSYGATDKALNLWKTIFTEQRKPEFTGDRKQLFANGWLIDPNAPDSATAQAAGMKKANEFATKATRANWATRGVTTAGTVGGGVVGHKVSSRLIKGKSGQLAESGVKKWAQRAGITLGTLTGALTGGTVAREISLNTIMASVGKKFIP